jgi:predicted ATP-grasp superfamily ATP-dependent carboligase
MALYKANEPLPECIIEIAIRMAIESFKATPEEAPYNVFTSAGVSHALKSIRGIEIGGYGVELVLMDRPYVEALLSDSGNTTGHYIFHPDKAPRRT